MIRIAFFDIDGTLVKLGSKRLTPNTLLALKKLKEKGVILCLATGRSYQAVPRFAGIEFDAILSFNGSYTRNAKEVIYTNPISQKDVNILVQNIRAMNKAVSISNENFTISDKHDDILDQYMGFGDEEVVVDDNFDSMCKEDLYQVMCAAHKDEYDEILKNTHNCKVAAWWDEAIDIIPKDGGKGKAIEKVLQYYGLTENQAIAFGDGRNDIEMLKAVGVGVAMGNAIDEVKKQADVICKTVEDDGVYYYCLDNNLL